MNGQNVIHLRSPDYRNDCEIEKESSHVEHVH